MPNYSRKIISVIESILKPDSYLYSNYLLNELKKPFTLTFIEEVINKSGKTPTEAVIITLVSIKYLSKDIDALKTIEKNNSFESLLRDNYNELLKIAINGKVQGNGPERALPILDALSIINPDKPVGIIELGASFGLIGFCLLNPNSLLNKKYEYFVKPQQFPKKITQTDYYLGIDLYPPDKDWLISCILNGEDAVRINKYITQFQPTNCFKLLKSSAIGFSKLSDVQELINKNIQLIIITSFMLYQLSEKDQLELSSEINSFCKNNNAHWIKQEIHITEGNPPIKYFIEYDNQRIIEIIDDKCSTWKWLDY